MKLKRLYLDLLRPKACQIVVPLSGEDRNKFVSFYGLRIKHRAWGILGKCSITDLHVHPSARTIYNTEDKRLFHL